MNPTKNSHEKMRVIRAIEMKSETGARDRWFEIRADDHSAWISMGELIETETEAFRKLNIGGMPCLTPAAKNHVKNLIQEHTHFEPGLVAERPGWCGEFYVFGDGTVAAPPKRSPDSVIMAFTPIAKFEPRGNLAAYRRTIKPVVRAQPLPMFAIYFALIPPLLRFAPADVTTYPMIELVGPRGSGKTVIACLAASVWAGADRLTGGAETWDLTEGSLDQLKQQHNDGLLVLDEANLAGSNRKQQADLIAKATFKLATDGSKRRMYEPERPSTRQAMLSTSNESLRDIVTGAPSVMDALSSRLVTILVDGELGVFHSEPKAFESAQDAIEDLRRSIANNFGSLGREFVERLVKKAAANEEGLCAEIAAAITEFRDHAPEKGDSTRVLKLFGLAYAAGRLASAWHLIQMSPETIRRMLTHIYANMVQRPQSAADKVAAYIEMNEIKPIGRAPLSPEAFHRTAGFLRERKGRQELLISTKKFKEVFLDANPMLAELDRAKLLQTENGVQRKLSVKAPKSICASGRVHVIKLDGEA